jgi:hypothetical protein
MTLYWTKHWTRGVFAVAKTVRERKLDSPAARAKLKHSGKPYWRAIDTGLHLGYRKGLNGGKWVLRRYLGKETYHVETIGIAGRSFGRRRRRHSRLLSGAAQGARGRGACQGT